jgi:hypothetical protein
MRPLSVLCILFFAITLVAFSQTSSIRIDGVSEPPELSGAPKKLDPPAQTGLLYQVEC